MASNRAARLAELSAAVAKHVEEEKKRLQTEKAALTSIRDVIAPGTDLSSYTADKIATNAFNDMMLLLYGV